MKRVLFALFALFGVFPVFMKEGGDRRGCASAQTDGGAVVKKILYGFACALAFVFFATTAHAAALPSGYTELSYIQSSGSQYIDTGIVVNSDTYIKTEFVIKNNISAGGAIFGARPTGGVGTGTQLGHTSDAKIVIDWLSGTRFTSTEMFQKDIPYIAEVSNRVFTIKNANTGTIITTNTFANGVSVDYNFALFGLNNGGTFIPSADSTQLKSFVIKNSNNSLVRNLIPAKNSSNVIGMYDTVSGQFFTNSGSGSFLPGEELDSCRNLLDLSNIQTQTGKAISADGSLISNSATNFCATYIPVQPSTTYTISGDVLGGATGTPTVAYFRLAEYNSSQQFIVRSDGVEGSSYTFTTGANTHYIRFHYVATADINTYQLKLAQCGGCSGGGTRRNYVSATGTGTQVGTPTPENPIDPVFFRQGDMILRAVGDYKDTFDATTGKITRRVGVKVLKGTENWTAFQSLGNDIARVYSTAILADIANVADTGMSTHFSVSRLDDRVQPNYIDTMQLGPIGSMYLGFKVHESNFASKDAFKQWIGAQYAAGTPVIIYYPLATPVEEDWDGGATYCETGIKIATNLYNSAKFQNVIDALDTAVSTINNIVAGTIAQANSIGELASGKQTRPNPADSSDETCPTSCPNYRQCLLVEKDDGTPCWYPINDPFYDFFKPILGASINGSSLSKIDGYTQLEYIESTGTQYIDTGVVVNSTNGPKIRLEIDGNFGTSASTSSGWTLDGSAYPDYHAYIGLNPAKKIVYGNDGDVVTGYTETDLTGRHVYVVDYVNGEVSRDGEKIVSFTTKNSTKAAHNIFIFGWSTSREFQVSAKKYNVKIYENNTLVRNFVPVLNNTTGKYGMYDKVYGVFYPNAAASGDDFTPGPIVANDAGVPSATWRVNWAADSNNNLDTGFVSGKALCNGVNGGSYATKATTSHLSNQNWDTLGTHCWCRVTSVNVDETSNPTDNGIWVHLINRSSVADCATRCTNGCAADTRTNSQFRGAIFDF